MSSVVLVDSVEQPGLSWVGLYEVSLKCRLMAPPGHQQITVVFYIFIFRPHHVRKPYIYTSTHLDSRVIASIYISILIALGGLHIQRG